MPMTTEGRKQAPSRTAPLVWSLILAACIGGCLCWLWLEHGAAQARLLADAESRLAVLEMEAEAVRDVLDLPPCEAKARLDARAPASGGEPARSPGAAASADPAPRAPEPAAAPAAPPPSVGGAADAEAACVFVVSANASSRLATGTGFFVAPGYVVTNSHVVAGAAGKILVTSRALHRPAIAEVAARTDQAGRDYALLRVDVPEGSVARPLAFAAGTRRTARVGAWGFPDVVGKNDPAYVRLLRGEDIGAVPELSYTEGVVSALLDRTPPLIVHTAPISPGNSGGPLVDDAGDIVGINTMITLDEDSYRQASIALSGTDLLHFLRQQGVPVQTR